MTVGIRVDAITIQNEPLRQVIVGKHPLIQVGRPDAQPQTARAYGRTVLIGLADKSGVGRERGCARSVSRSLLPNLFVSMLQRMGLETDKFASATGTMRGLELA